MVASLTRRACVAVGLFGIALGAHAQQPSQAQPAGVPSDYVRTQAFSYYADGTLLSATTEPNNAASCSVTTQTYDAYGNVASSTLANCGGAAGRALFATRVSSALYAGTASQAIVVNGTSMAVAVPPGLAATTLQNPLGQTESRQIDPRFGVAIQTTDIAGLSTSVVIDAFGRTVSQVHADGTSTAAYYCILAATGLDTSSNSANCVNPTAGEAPSVAVRYEQQELHDTNGAKSGPYQRTYYDSLDRAIRVATESFDGSAQPSARSGVPVLSDVVYDTNGAQVLTSKPFFLSSGSSSTAGANDVGATATVYDELRCPSLFGFQPAALMPPSVADRPAC